MKYIFIFVFLANNIDCNSQIIVTIFSPPKSIQFNGEGVDIDNNGSVDYSFYKNWEYCGPIYGNVTHPYINSSTDFYYSQTPKISGDSISNNISSWTTNSSSFCVGCMAYPGFWESYQGSKEYLAIKFIENSKIHYGWLRFINGSYPNYCITHIISFAYNSIPNSPILAGQTLDITDNIIFNNEIYLVNNQLTINNINGLLRNYTISIVDFLGKTLFNDEINCTDCFFDLNFLNRGVYIVKIDKENVMLHKKIVIQ